MPRKARSRIARVRFTPDELAAIRQKAKDEGVPLSVYLRRLALTARTDADSRREFEERMRRAFAADAAISDEEAEELLAVVRRR